MGIAASPPAAEPTAHQTFRCPPGPCAVRKGGRERVKGADCILLALLDGHAKSGTVGNRVVSGGTMKFQFYASGGDGVRGWLLYMRVDSAWVLAMYQGGP